jgi:crotonobetainyl-CoA:carnitine CoA-transferase CaiB-like acyl-CoA transferase
MDAASVEGYRLLLSRIGLSEDDPGGEVRFVGSDPVIPSRLRYGAGTASALAAQAAAIATIWRMRSGRGQDITVDLRRAVALGLRTVQNLRQNGRSFTVGSTTRASNFFKTADGRTIYLLRNTGRLTITTDLIGMLRCENTTESLTAAVAKWKAGDLEEAPAERPMSGLRVLDASHVIAGPATGRMLAEHGAEVLHVTTPKEQEHVHVMMDTGFGKRAAYIDLSEVADVAQLRELAKKADIFIQSWRPGGLARKGFSPRDVAAIRPGIVYVSISCYGDEGPWAARGGYEPIGQVATGLSATEGTFEEPKNAPTVTMNDYLTAYLAAAGATGALVRRAREGGSYHVKTSLCQASMWVLGRGILKQPIKAPPLSAYVPGEGEILSMKSSFGDLKYVAPIAQFSETPASWATPPEPAGASAAQWQ